MILPSLPQDPKTLAAIGAVAVRHGQLDYALRMTIKSISGIGLESALLATEGKGSNELRQLVRKMAKRKLGDASNSYLKLEALLFRSQEATRQRNELMHGLWAFDLGQGRDRFRHRGKEWQEAPEPERLQGLADEIAHIADELHIARSEGFLKEALIEAREA